VTFLWGEGRRGSVFKWLAGKICPGKAEEKKRNKNLRCVDSRMAFRDFWENGSALDPQIKEEEQKITPGEFLATVGAEGILQTCGTYFGDRLSSNKWGLEWISTWYRNFSERR